MSVTKKGKITPLILLASQNDKYEIIDGMQRLNAIFGYIENHFGVFIDGVEKYFNIPDYTFAQSQVTKGLVSPKIDSAYLTQEQVSAFIGYPFPVTIFKTGSTDEIKKIEDSIHKPLYDKMHEKLNKDKNYTRFLTKRRSSTVEPVLGTLINYHNMKRINSRGMAQANKHVLMAALTYNLKKYLRFVVKKPSVLAQVLSLKQGEEHTFLKTLFRSLQSSFVRPLNSNILRSN